MWLVRASTREVGIHSNSPTKSAPFKYILQLRGSFPNVYILHLVDKSVNPGLYVNKPISYPEITDPESFETMFQAMLFSLAAKSSAQFRKGFCTEVFGNTSSNTATFRT